MNLSPKTLVPVVQVTFETKDGVFATITFKAMQRDIERGGAYIRYYDEMWLPDKHDLAPHTQFVLLRYPWLWGFWGGKMMKENQLRPMMWFQFGECVMNVVIRPIAHRLATHLQQEVRARLDRIDYGQLTVTGRMYCAMPRADEAIAA